MFINSRTGNLSVDGIYRPVRDYLYLACVTPGIPGMCRTTFSWHVSYQVPGV